MKTTTDLWFAAYLTISGEPLSGYIKQTVKKVVFEFNIDDDKWREYKVQYFNSDLGKFRQAQERLKDLLY